MNRTAVVATQTVLWALAVTALFVAVTAEAAMVSAPPAPIGTQPAPGVPAAVWLVGADAVALACAYGVGRLRKEVLR